ncbi:glycosyl transferase group 1 [Fibrisoma limi BUZ 3]|uniref:Glycosyl transferase group 1 n=1 Tax=Fibrisoma limi BUZ 3 TaxID=1185876 RepID=I2GFA0_9BACT|nr:glycosyltransferase family 1 protein [Fibrisoma limi]CCH52575.1 glycosyl transferase group 1 [Fibrisoma limi BUZ 3]
MLNITVDASLLGLGLYHRQARTGVGRVNEQLVHGLWQAPDVRLSLAAPTHLAETMRYARQTFGAGGPTFINRVGEQRWAGLENTLLSPFAPESLPSKVIREGFYRTKKALGRDQARFGMGQVPRGGVYHSPFYAIPAPIGQDSGIRKVQTIHDLIPVFHPEWFPDGDDSVKRMIGTLPADACVVTVSEATKQDFCNYTHFDPDRVVPIRLAASKDLFHPVSDEGRQRAVRQRLGVGEEPYLLSLATLEPRKNIDHLIRCFVQLVESGALSAEVKLVLVGTKGWKFDKILAELARNESVQSRLVFTGFVPDEDLAPLYAGALAFVYPSLYEGFGLPPLEAMQCGLPVITSNVSSLPEVVGDAAIQVAPTDADALCQAMLDVTQSGALRTELAAKAVQRAGLFSWEKFVQEHITLYQTLTN